jgi:hypothetical protein
MLEAIGTRVDSGDTYKIFWHENSENGLKCENIIYLNKERVSSQIEILKRRIEKGEKITDVRVLRVFRVEIELDECQWN